MTIAFVLLFTVCYYGCHSTSSEFAGKQACERAARVHAAQFQVYGSGAVQVYWTCSSKG